MIHAFGEMATKGVALPGLNPALSAGSPTSVEAWTHYLRLLHVSCSVDVLALQIRVLLALAQPSVRVRHSVSWVCMRTPLWSQAPAYTVGCPFIFDKNPAAFRAYGPHLESLESLYRRLGCARQSSVAHKQWTKCCQIHWRTPVDCFAPRVDFFNPLPVGKYCM